MRYIKYDKKQNKIILFLIIKLLNSIIIYNL